MKKNHPKPQRQEETPRQRQSTKRIENRRELNQEVVFAEIAKSPKEEKHLRQKVRKENPAVITRIFSWIFAIVLLAVSGGVCYFLLRYGILPQPHRSIVIGIVVIINLIVWILLITGQKRKPHVRTALALAVVFSIVMSTAVYYIYFGVMALDNINNRKNIRSTNLQLIVKKESTYMEPADVADQVVQAPIKTESEPLDAYVESVQERFNVSLDLTDVPSYPEAVENLYAGKAEAIVFNSAMYETISDTHPNFKEETRIIDEWAYDKKVQDVAKPVDTANSGFNIYISGIDTYGQVSSVSRSDVNIIMTINPDTNHMLLTSVPRDTYMPIAGGGGGHKDKLTHAGIYGVESSIRSLEDFLDTDINYYARVNFTSLINIVDKIGGIDVENPVVFDGSTGYSFPAGTVHMNGEEALAYSRERYSLAGGDFDRGRNQERVIIAIFNKVNNPEFLLNYREVMDELEDSVQTNMPTEDMVKLINEMIVDRSPWKTEMQDVKGKGNPNLRSHLIPGRDIYLMEANPESVKEVQEKISEALKGIIREPEDSEKTKP